MGKGISLQVKRAFPANFKDCERACKRKEVVLGKMFVFDNGQFTRPCWIVNFPSPFIVTDDANSWRERASQLLRLLLPQHDSEEPVVSGQGCCVGVLCRVRLG